MLLTAGLFPGLCFGIAFSLNTIAIFYHSLAAVPFGTMVVIFFMWAFISFPLVLFGTVIGRNWNGKGALIQSIHSCSFACSLDFKFKDQQMRAHARAFV